MMILTLCIRMVFYEGFYEGSHSANDSLSNRHHILLFISFFIRARRCLLVKKKKVDSKQTVED